MVVNYYEILEIPSDADEREIKRAYHRLARALHPDKAGSSEEARTFEERFAQVSAAYNTLKDPDKRSAHDAQVNKGSATATARRTPTATVLSASREVPSATGNGNKKETSGGGAKSAQLGITPEKVAIAQKAFAKGMQFYKDGNYVKAAEFFEAAIRNNDTEAIYFSRLATSLINAKRSATRAITHAQRAVDLDPYNVEHKFNLALIFETIGSRTNAQKVYQDILKWDAGNTRALAALEALKKKRKTPMMQQTQPTASQGAQPGLIEWLVSLFKYK